MHASTPAHTRAPHTQPSMHACMRHTYCYPPADPHACARACKDTTRNNTFVYACILCMHTCLCIINCIHASMHSCIGACMHPCIHASMHPCVHASMHPCIDACIHPFIHASVHRCIHPSVRPSVRPSVHPSIHACMHPSIHPSTHPRVDALARIGYARGRLRLVRMLVRRHTRACRAAP